MPNFTPSFTKQFTNNCQTLKVTDTSNYGFSINDEHYEKTDFPTKRIVLRDIFGTTLTMQDLDTNGETTFNLSLLSLNQLYLNISLELAGIGISYNLGSGFFLPCAV